MKSSTADGVRKRRKHQEFANKFGNVATTFSKTKIGFSAAVEKSSGGFSMLQFARISWTLVGLAVCTYAGHWFALYVKTLHENQMWFTNIQQVEREISLRTECGLYYSYYKQLVHSPSFIQGLNDLQVDNVTEHGRTVNLLQRFNIYQEVLLAWLYRIWPGAYKMQPILFYVYSVFHLNGFYVTVLFALAWLLCGGGSSWLAGLLCATFYTVNLTDSTRVSFSINLRESFGFPIFWCQILLICLFLRRCYHHVNQTLLSVAILFLSYLFALTWQFNQFILLIQCGSLYAVGLLHLTPQWKVRRLLLIQMFALLLACATQFWQPMLLGSLLIGFVPAAVISLYSCRTWSISGGIVTGSLKLIIQSCFTLLLTVALHYSAKKWLRLDADDHIFKFLKGKFGFADPSDFESRIYLCHGAFVFLDNDYFRRTTHTLVFPLYMLMLCGSLFIVGKDILSEWCCLVDPKSSRHVPFDKNDVTDKIFYFNRRPELAYLVIQSAVSGLLAMMALRMKYLWTPHICVLASVFLGDVDMWHLMVNQVRPKTAFVWSRLATSILCASFSVGLIYGYLPTYRQHMTDLKEFYDPDTVGLMNWIGNNTRQADSFAGSMQLLAGVKCCTGRHVTNHPHFEDKWLRDRTIQVYQMYGRRKAEEVHKILKSFHTNFIILEDSICLAKSDGCRLPDLIDLDNRHVPDSGYSNLYGLRKSQVPRFCDEIRRNAADFTSRFQLVMENRTFRVYRVV